VIEKPIFAFYGDDFTGSTDALEALAINHIPAVLFLRMPDVQQLREFANCRAVGIAGESRSRSPQWMSDHLPLIFQTLKDTGASICQYKVCSTFDSSPETGNIGRALEIGKQVFGAEFVPVFSAAPHLKRYVLFANLFAAAGACVYRIDRHPTMSCHPVTPMRDGDLRAHLAWQTKSRVVSFDMPRFAAPDPESELRDLLSDHPDAVLFDGWDEQSLRMSARMIWEHRAQAPFVVGSSGFTHGLAALLRTEPQSQRAIESNFPQHGVDRIVVVSGSCSPITERQIHWAMSNGFAGYRINVQAIADPATADSERKKLLEDANRSLQSGSGVVLYSALGPTDCRQVRARNELGTQMGLMLRELLLRSGVQRVLIAGGDTSTHAGQQLGVYALTVQAPLTPGAPLCKAHSEDDRLHGLELVLKGGQVGPDDFFGAVLKGRM